MGFFFYSFVRILNSWWLRWKVFTAYIQTYMYFSPSSLNVAVEAEIQYEIISCLLGWL